MRVSRGSAKVSPDARALIVRDADALRVFRDGAPRACATLEELSACRAVSWSDDGVTCVAASSSSSGDVVVYDASTCDVVRRWFGVDARDVAFAPSSSAQVVLSLNDDGAVVVGDARSGQLITLGVVNVKFSVARSIAYSPCGRWMAVLSRDARARDGVDVFSRGDVAGALSFRAKSSDARAIEWTTTFNGDYVLLYDDSCDVDAVPTLVVHRSDGALRATFKNVLARARARTKSSLIVHSSNDGLIWINETRWEVTRCVHHPWRLHARGVSGSTRVYRESGASYEKLAKYEATTLTDAVGGDIAVSPCETMLASTCASRSNVLFLWSATSFASTEEGVDDDPLAIFVHDGEVTAKTWVADDRVSGGSKLIFLCAGKSRVYTWIPGAVAPASMALPQSFMPHIIEGVYAGKLILATRSRSEFVTCEL